MTTQPAPFDRLHPVVQHHIVNTLGWRSLRPLQEQAVDPLLRGDDALLLAPTAGGKTEAAMFPLLSRMADEGWRGTSLLYVCPLRALLNNLEPRIAAYASWLGRTASVRHGDTSPAQRRRQSLDRPDVLLTTPESLEAMLVSTTVDPHILLADVRCVVIDEVHAFAGDDRGWHLLAVLERIARIAGRPLQRVGLSATVGNAPELLAWLQGSNREPRGVSRQSVGGATADTSDPSASVVRPPDEHAATPDLELDYVGSLANAAKVISVLHLGEKRLVFADSRRVVEELAVLLRGLGTETFVSHSSLSVDERRRSETAFAEATNCVIVSTSTLELGIDVGDLDRVIQIGSPATVGSFLQRLGRTGRRPDTTRNTLFLTVDDDQLLLAAGMLQLWSQGYVEPIEPPELPRHLAAQQLLALALQEGRVGQAVWPEWLGGLPLAQSADLPEITDWMLSTGHLDRDTGMLFVGPEAERRYGRRHFLEVMSVFTSNPQVTVLHGRNEIGVVDPMMLTRKTAGPRLLALAGRTWRATHVDWNRRRVYVEPAEGRATARWVSTARPYSFRVTDAMRRVLLGTVPSGVQLTDRARTRLTELRSELDWSVHPERSVLVRDDSRVSWWTWAGGRANAVLHAVLSDAGPGLVADSGSYDNKQILLDADAQTAQLGELLRSAARRGLRTFSIDVDEKALEGLKFVEMLPRQLATQTLAARQADYAAAEAVAERGSITRVL